MSIGQSRVVGAVFSSLGVAWIAWEEAARAGYVALLPVKGLHVVFIAIGLTFLYFYPRSLKGK